MSTENSAMEPDCLSAALDLVRRRLPITLCRGKQPIGKQWQRKRWTEAQVKEAFDGEPSLNVGIIWGPESGLIDIEADSDNERQAFDELFAGVEVPQTAEFRSKRGSHRLFKFPAEFESLSAAVVSYKGLGIRIGAGGKGAHSLVAPSATDGFTRQWLTPIEECEAAELPADVIARILDAANPKPNEPTATAPQGASKLPNGSVTPACSGQPDLQCLAAMIDATKNMADRNDGSKRLYVCCCRVVEHDLDDTAAIATIFAYAEQRPFPKDWDTEQIRERLRQAEHVVKRGSALVARLSGSATPTKTAAEPLCFQFRTSAELAASKDAVNYIVSDIWPERQGGIIGGRFKTLKTSVAIDLAISAATETRFLGRFAVPKAVPVGIFSAESGWPTLRERGHAVARSKSLDLADISNLVWSDASPKLTRPQHCDALTRFIEEHALKGLLIDPAYLALCDIGDQATNVFSMGGFLSVLTEIIDRTGCSIVLLHHHRKGRSQGVGRFDPPDLSEISMAGFAEWARFWLLLGPRKEWEPETGRHWLWLQSGGSAGHAGLWHLDVTEGTRSDPNGRIWQPSVIGATEGKRQAAEAKAIAKADAARAAIDVAKAKIVAELRRLPDGETKTVLRDATGLKTAKFGIALGELLNERRLTPKTILKNQRPYSGYALSA